MDIVVKSMAMMAFGGWIGLVITTINLEDKIKHNAVIESLAIQEIVNRIDAISQDNQKQDSAIVDLNYRVEDIINKIKQMDMEKK